jgi:hypothetical protein
MDDYELKKETDAFRLGYWDGYVKKDKEGIEPVFLVKSNLIDYRRGYRSGIDQSYRDAGYRK